ncbi:RNA methyltransferase [Bacillaceae bacterium JMAK1]|nr:RNA methyltransferase [Bacillaceae bacterium JMAK1]
MSETYTFIATATMGLESIVAKEIKALGYKTTVENGKVMWDGPIESMIEANLWVRTSDRIKLVVGEFDAFTFDELFEKTKALPWEDFIPVYGEFPVDGRSVKSTLFSISDCQRIVKKAVVERLKETYNQEWFKEDGPKFQLEVALLKDKATLTIDTSGEGLHKRGYRRLHNRAPLKETLAAALISLTNWRYDEPFLDPFCGSGTIPIEAALMAKNIAPGLYRNFESEQWPWIDENLWAEARERAKAKIVDREIQIYGSDHDRELIELSTENAKLAHVPEIQFERNAVQDLKAPAERGILVANPPYGTRLEDEKTVQRIYRQLGDVVHDEFPFWSVYVITANEQFEEAYGEKATKKRKLYNGNIKTDYYQFWAKRR